MPEIPTLNFGGVWVITETTSPNTAWAAENAAAASAENAEWATETFTFRTKIKKIADGLKTKEVEYDTEKKRDSM